MVNAKLITEANKRRVNALLTDMEIKVIQCYMVVTQGKNH